MIIRLILFLVSLTVWAEAPVSSSFPVSSKRSSLPVPLVSTDSWSKDFSVRNVGKFQVSNARGSIRVQGWALDKVRVKATRRILTANPDLFLKAKNSADFKFRSVEKDQDLLVEYGKNLEITEKNKEHQEKWVLIDLEIQAPYSLPLLVRAQDGDVSVQGWQSSVEVRSTLGQISISELRGQWVNLLCQECSFSIKDVKASLRILGGENAIKIEKLKGDSVFVESTSGLINMSEVTGEMTVLSQKGKIQIHSVNGSLDLRSVQGDVEVLNSSGSLNAHLEKGKLSAQYLKWKFTDQVLIENLKGEIDLRLPQSFSGELDMRSNTGTIENRVPFTRELSPEISGPTASKILNRRIGIVKDGGERLILRTVSGSISVSLMPKSIRF